MIRDKADAVTLVMALCGVALLVVVLTGWWLPPQIVGYLVVGGIGAGLLLAGHRHLDLNVQEKFQQIEQTKQQTTALWLSNVERERRLEATVKPAAPTVDHRLAWAEALHRFVQWGDLAGGFSIRRLTAPDSLTRCCTWDDWFVLVELLAGWGVLTAEGNRTRFADDWTLARWERERAGYPYPTDRPAPKVSIPTHANAPNTAPEAVGG